MKHLLSIVLLLPLLAGADMSFYRGFGTTHIFMDNTQFNNTNEVTVIKLNGLLGGGMVNSFNEAGFFVGYQPTIYKDDKFQIDAGLVAVTGYRRWQLPHFHNYAARYDEKVLAVLPVLSASYQLNEYVALQVNNMSGIVMNYGLRFDYKF